MEANDMANTSRSRKLKRNRIPNHEQEHLMNFPTRDENRVTRERHPETDLMTTRSRGGQLVKSFPESRGPMNVGCVDIMTKGTPKESVFGRLYYPTNYDVKNNPDRWTSYIDSNEYVKGMKQFKASVAQKWPSWAPSKDISNFHLMKLVLPVLPEFLYVRGFNLMMNNLHIQAAHRAPLKDTYQKLPVVVFSHGIGCSRFLYSQICCDLASFGFIVAAVEHRDESACKSRYYDNHRMHWVNHRRVYYGDDEYGIRNEQVHHRSQECIRMLDLLTSLNEGVVPQNVVNIGMKVDRREVLETQAYPWHMFEGRIELSDVFMVGHSFGGATTLLTLANDPRFKVGVCLDPWMFPISHEELAKEVHQPVLFVNTETFRNQENLRKQAEFKQSDKAKRKSVYIVGSVHQNHLDISIAVKKQFVRKCLGMESGMDPLSFLELNNNLILQFLFREGFGSDHPTISRHLMERECQVVEGFAYEDAPKMIDLDFEREFGYPYREEKPYD